MPDQTFRARLGRLSAIVMILPSSMGAGWILGYFLLDSYLTPFPWGSILCTLLAAGAGFYEIFKILIPPRGVNGDKFPK